MFHLLGVKGMRNTLFPRKSDLVCLGEEIFIVQAAIVCLGHDLLEDTEITEEDLNREGFPVNVVNAIDLVTKKEGVSYKNYLKFIAMDELAYQAKISDTNFNLQQSLMDSNFNRIAKYGKQLELLAKYRQEFLGNSVSWNL